MPVIQVTDLKKDYILSERPEGFWGSVKGLVHRKTKIVSAVKGVSFSIEPGELVAFLGPNGAGKTTTLKMLSGLLYPSGGSINVLGHTPFDKNHEYLRRFSFVMGQRHQLWWELPALDTFRLNAAVFDLSEERYKRRLKELDELLKLDPLWHTPVKKLSLGQRMKMELACSLLHEPELLLLDEPTLGLDVVMQKTLRDFIAHVNKTQNTTVLLTSHNMEDIETLCRRVIVIHHGVLLFDGDLDKLMGRFAPSKQVKAVFTQQVAEASLVKFGEVKEVAEQSAQWEIPREKISQSVGQILKELPVADLAVEEMPLEEVIRKIFVGGKL